MKSYKVISTLSIVAAFGLAACGDSSSSPSGGDSSASQSEEESVVESFDDLPSCKSKIDGEVYTVEDDADYICSEGEWVEVVSKVADECSKKEKGKTVYSKKKESLFVCDGESYVAVGEDEDSDDDSKSSASKDSDDDSKSSASKDSDDDGNSSASKDSDDDGNSSASKDSDDDGNSSASTKPDEGNSSASTKPNSSNSSEGPSVTGTDILGGNGEFTANNKIITPTGSDYTKVGVFNFYQWDANGNENGTIEYIRNDDNEVVVQFYPTKNNSNIWDLQLEKDITVKAGYSYQIFVEGYDYGTSRNIHIGIQSLRGVNGTSYENYISNEGSYWNTEEYNWKSGKALVCQTKTAQFYINAGGKKGEGIAIKSLKIIEEKMPSGICDGDVTGTDILSGNGEFMANDRIISPTGTDYTKVGVFNFYQWDADGNENGTIKYIRNLDSEVVVEFYPTKNNANIWDLQLEKDITIKKGYAYQVVLQGYDYGVHRDIHVGIQSLFDENTPGASYENYISDEGSYWNTEENNWRSGKALVCQTKTAQLYVNAGGNEGEGVALQTLKVLEQAMPSGICD